MAEKRVQRKLTTIFVHLTLRSGQSNGGAGVVRVAEQMMKHLTWEEVDG